MKIIIVRHAQSQANIKKIISSTLPGLDLSFKGISQAQDIGQTLSQTFYIDHIYSSPFLRTIHTANIINSYFKLPYIIPDLRIGEMFFGILDGKLHEEIKEDMQLYLENLSKNDYSIRLGNFGESEYSFRDRLLSFLIEIGLRHNKDNILIVTHQTPGGILQEMVNNYTGHISLKPATYVEIELTANRVQELIKERNELLKFFIK